MMNNEKRRSRSGQIPAFGDWEYGNDLPITQYFQDARQAGLIPYKSQSQSQCESDLYHVHVTHKTTATKKRSNTQHSKVADDYNVDLTAPSTIHSQLTALKKKNHHHYYFDDVNYNVNVRPIRAPKPVDEDLYKISPHLLHISKRKKMLGFFPRCLLPPCVV